MTHAEYIYRRNKIRYVARYHKRRLDILDAMLINLEEAHERELGGIPLTPGQYLRPKHPWPLMLCYPVK
jgi:hypothetical protein